MRLLLVQSPGNLSGITASPPVTPLDAAEWEHSKPEEHWCVLDGDDRLCGRCSIWWSQTPAFPGPMPALAGQTPALAGQTVGAIGHYAALGAESASALIRHACRRLSEKGCTLAIAPLDGDTWRRYRFVTQRGDGPPFFLEPDNPPDYPGHFVDEEFTPLATYYSTLNADLTREVHGVAHGAERMERLGVRFRPLDVDHVQNELARIHRLCAAAFRRNFLYTPIDEAEFTAAYTALLPHVRPELILLAERGDDLVGFLFGVPDILQERRGDEIDTVILKTIAIDPDRRYAGLGRVLLAGCQKRAHEMGYHRAIHALMHEDNSSRGLSAPYARIMRRYTLFARTIAR